MIIDLILDRKDGSPYNAREFYWDVLQYESIFDFDCYGISRAMDYGTNKDVQNALCKYIREQQYNPNICDYVKTQDWLQED